jgi:hypothetical protein
MIIVRIRAPQSRPVSFVAATKRATLWAIAVGWFSPKLAQKL